MFDAPMHDFSGENAMDADMVPSSTSDADWLQVETMMEDGDVSKPLAEEVDMIHGDVQEFEMRDAGEVEFTDGLDQMLPEPQDQDIPDVSRAPSPSTQITFSQPKTLPIAMRSDDLPQDSPTEQEVIHSVQPDPTTSHRQESLDESLVQLPELSEEQILLSQAGVAEEIIDNHDTSTLSGESNRSPYPQPQEPLPEPPGHSSDAQDVPTDYGLVAHTEDPQGGEHSLPGGDEEGVDPGPQSEARVENQVTQDEEVPLIDPPPPVLLSYSFDGSHFTLFNLPEEPQPDSVGTVTQIPSTGHDEEKRESDAKQVSSLADNLATFEAPILLFRERFALYYEPLSHVFEALRADEAINTGGRFDHNIELVISAPELDLTLPEDNINTREVSLHDLGILHTGCDLTGPLFLRLDTISPRFGTRYKAIRDEIVRVMSQQEEDERRSQFETLDDLYTDGEHTTDSLSISKQPPVTGVLLHELPDGHPQHDGPNNFSSEHNQPDPVEHTNENDEQSSKSKTGVDDNNTHKDAHHVQAEEEEPDAEGYEDAESGEYAEYEQYDEPTGIGGDDLYEGAEGEYAEQEKQGTEAAYAATQMLKPIDGGEEQEADVTDGAPEEEDAQSLLPKDANDSETVGEDFAHAYENTVYPDDKDPYTADASEEHDTTPSTQYAPVEEFTDPHASTSAVIDDGSTDTPELDNSVHEVMSHDFLLPTEPFSDTEPLLSETRPRSGSDTSPLNADTKHAQDEVIAYEDTMADDYEAPDVSKQPTLSATSGIPGSRAVSSKRSYDEHEFDQHDAQYNLSSETKRLRVD
ncbi:hypothetical protein JB92DRAFT_3134579 [Gautieria morchelliformis]|nr:hypothetical protein JB92DRAFT_3134579 [Gautieria morchelliformis]